MSNTRSFPDFLQELISHPPKAGAGVHSWLFRVARQLHAHLPAGEIVNLLEQQAAHCGRHVPRREIIQAVQNAMPVAWERSANSPAPPREAKWPSVNQEQREAIIANGYRLADLWEFSTTRIEENRSHAEEIVDRLFPGNPLLCCGKSNCEFDTKPREEWRGELGSLSLIVPSPMSAVTGVTQEGKTSKHSLNNTGERRFLVCEFDKGSIDEHAALLLHLAEVAPMVCAVFSGSKSLHGWFYVHGQPEEKVRKLFRYAVSIGADPATWTRSQFVRMPDGTRENGKQQTVYFLNYQPLPLQ